MLRRLAVAATLALSLILSGAAISASATSQPAPTARLAANGNPISCDWC